MEWLRESARLGSPADEELFAFEPLDPKSKASLSPTDWANNNNTGTETRTRTRIQESTNKSDSEAKVRESEERYQRALESFDPEATIDMPQISTPGQSFETEAEAEVTTETVVQDAGKLFSGKKFSIILEEEEDPESIVNAITTNGGKVVDHRTHPFDYSILPVLHSVTDRKVLNAPHFTEQWIVSFRILFLYIH